jgi:hypothetical protein
MEPGSSLQSSSADDESMTRPTEQADVRQNDARRRRHKVSLACEACRARKIKCDGAIPVHVGAGEIPQKNVYITAAV